ncbi:MAG: peptidoglycan DD-metalloendopeptidase family protein [Ignavibacteriales bacterium]|nr:peptidoglycan DD-metalloendopeptidase family protein [Ignavibacteriales bacterium]MCF8436403.1 peptidoglycan DD-metalloendopeptidase family protein [Ignavibacteriales bacterium]
MATGMIKYFLLLLLMFSGIFAQSRTEIDKNWRAIDSLKKHIEMLGEKFDEISQKEKENYTVLENFKNQELLLDKVIVSLRDKESNLEKQIDATQSEITKIHEKSGKLKSEYSSYLNWLYKNGGESWISYLFKAGSIRQAFERWKYLSVIDDNIKIKLSSLKDMNQALLSKKRYLEQLSDQNVRVLTAREEEEKNIQANKSNQQKLIGRLQKDKKSIAEEIKEKRRAQEKIKEYITRLIEEENRRLAAEREKKVVPPPVFSDEADLMRLKGRINWPVSRGSIFRKSGEIRNKKLNTVTLNYGIDIKTQNAADVFVVAEGIVSVVEWIPGYGGIIIVTHKNDFRTVYGNVRDLQVKSGSKLKAGDILGKVGENLEGNILHFEIWKARDYQNPEQWLVVKR